MAHPSVLHLAIQLANPQTRTAAAEQLARQCGGQGMLVFLHDHEVDAFLTVPGMVQTLPAGQRWQDFMRRCVANGTGTDVLPVTADIPHQNVTGYATGDDIVVVLIGTHHPTAEFDEFRELLPLVSATFRGEQQAKIAAAHARIAAESAAASAALTRSLDAARRRLEKANQELQAARAEAEAANKAKGEFLATMSHELRTPLNAISGYLEILLLEIQGPLNAQQRESLERIDRSQRHLLRLINEVLNFARIEAGRVEYHISEVSLRHVIDEIMPIVEPQIAANRLICHVDVPPHVIAKADREKLSQILLNLLSNAIKFTPPGGSIWLSADVNDEGACVIQVRDTGRGIPADKLQAIFDPFVQVEGVHTRTADGSGLGLSISRDLARGMGGEITVESTEGQFSTFTLTLPRAEAIVVAN